MVNKKFVSKVDEKLKAAEARRAELERNRAAEQEKKMALRRERWNNATGNAGNKKVCNNENSKEHPQQLEQTLPPLNKEEERINVKQFKYLRHPDGSAVKLDWERKRRDAKCGIKLFTLKCVENLVEREEFDMAEVILGVMKRSVEARHPIQNKFAHLHGRIVEIKERNKRIFSAASALNFVGSISPVRVPDFGADLNRLSRLSSPIGMEEIAGKYSNIEELYHANEKKNKDKKEVEVERVINDAHAHMHMHVPFDYNDDYEITSENTFENNNAENEPKVHDFSKTKPSDQVEATTNFPSVISPMKRPQKDIEAEVVYTPQRKSARRLTDDEIIYADENVSQILLRDPNAAFVTNPYITLSPTKNVKKSPVKKNRTDN